MVSTIQIANNLPLWATLFYLLRSGHEKEALAFVAEQESHFTKLEKTFVAYFKAWIENGMR